MGISRNIGKDRMIVRRILSGGRVWVWVCALVVGVDVAGAGEGEGGGLGGGEREDWRGAVDVIGDAPIEFIVHLGAAPGGGATLDIPAQGIRGEALSDHERTGESVRFTLRFAGKPESAWAKFEMALSKDGKSATGTMTQWGQRFPAVMRLIPPGGDEGAAGEEEKPYSTREVSFTNAGDGVRLAGTLTIPGAKPRGRVAGDRRYPVALIVSDEADAEAARALAAALAGAGIASLRLDERGVGGSTGEKAKASAKELETDVRGALGLLRVQPDVDGERMALIGMGRGAAAVGRVGEEVKGVVGTALIGMGGVGLEKTTAEKSGTKARLILREAGLGDEGIESIRKWLTERFGVSEKRAE